MPHVVISHAKEDRAATLEIQRLLGAAGLSTWIDVKSARSLQGWRALGDAIRASRILVLCLSTRSVETIGFEESQLFRALYVLEFIQEDDVYVVPVRLDDCQVPRRLSYLHCIDYFEPEGRDALVGALLQVPKAREAGGKLSAEPGPPRDPVDRGAVLEGVARDLAYFLARTVNDSEEAKTLARQAGFPREHLPDFQTASAFWGNVIDQALHGRIELEPLVQAALQQFPHNPGLNDCNERLETLLVTSETESRCLEMASMAASPASFRYPLGTSAPDPLPASSAPQLAFAVIDTAHADVNWKRHTFPQPRLFDRLFGGYPAQYFVARRYGSHADPTFDVTIINQCDQPILIIALGVRVWEIANRPRHLLGIPEALPVFQSDFYTVEIPNVLAPHDIEKDFGPFDVGVTALMRLPDPIYMQPSAPYRYGLLLKGYDGHVPNRCRISLVAVTNVGEAVSPKVEMSS